MGIRTSNFVVALVASVVCLGVSVDLFADAKKEGILIGYCYGAKRLEVAGNIGVRYEAVTPFISTTITENIPCDSSGFFIKKLPAGDYLLYSIDSNKFAAEGLRFEIWPGYVHYIGSIYPQWRTQALSRKFTKQELTDTVFVGTYCYGLDVKNEAALVTEPLAVFFINNFKADIKKIQLKYPKEKITKKHVVNLLTARFTAIFKVASMNGLQN